MTTFAIGDIQGCYTELTQLLELIQFRPQHDTLWCVGDLVNRGPHSCDVLRLLANLPHCIVTLGNHDLHLLACASGIRPYKPPHDTFTDVLTAPDKADLIHWLRQQPLLHCTDQYIMVHAGLAPMWDQTTAMTLANEAAAIIQSDLAADFFENMYGDEPSLWDYGLVGNARYRCIVNYLTRMRFCNVSGRYDLSCKDSPDAAPPGMLPWFTVPARISQQKIIFGHWASLQGITHSRQHFALDTGCVWGQRLTALRVDDETLFSVGCARQIT